MKKRVLTEAEWSKVFTARCRSKRGEHLSDDDRSLVEVAYTSDPKRYKAMEPDVFDATVPCGSEVRAKRR
jgi:hypothetical protein